MKVAFLSNFTIDFLAKEFQTCTNFETYVSGLNQFRFDIYNPNSNYYLAKHDFSVLMCNGSPKSGIIG